MQYTPEGLKEKLLPIFGKYNIELAYFFGSQYKGTTGPLSDVDLAVLWSETEPLPMIKSLNLQSEIQQALKDKRIEVGPLNDQNLSFIYNVISSGACIFGKEEDRVRFETRLLSEYLDFSYLANEYNRAFYNSIMGGN